MECPELPRLCQLLSLLLRLLRRGPRKSAILRLRQSSRWLEVWCRSPEFDIHVDDMEVELDVNDISVHTHEFSEGVRAGLAAWSDFGREEAAKAQSEPEIGTSARAKPRKKRKLVHTASKTATQSTQPYQPDTTPPWSPIHSPQTTEPISLTTPSPKPKSPSPPPQIPSKQPIPTTTTPPPVQVTTSLLRISPFSFMGGTQSTPSGDIAATLARHEEELHTVREEVSLLRVENSELKALSQRHANEFRRSVDEIRGLHGREVSLLQDAHRRGLEVFRDSMQEAAKICLPLRGMKTKTMIPSLAESSELPQLTPSMRQLSWSLPRQRLKNRGLVDDQTRSLYEKMRKWWNQPKQRS